MLVDNRKVRAGSPPKGQSLLSPEWSTLRKNVEELVSSIDVLMLNCSSGLGFIFSHFYQPSVLCSVLRLDVLED